MLKKKQVETAESAAYSIPQAGAMVGLSRNGAYDAARRGEIPVLEFGRKKIVPKALWDRMLGISAAPGDAAIDQCSARASERAAPEVRGAGSNDGGCHMIRLIRIDDQRARQGAARADE